MTDIESLPAEGLAEIGERKIHQTVIIKLNGGLGTSMGMQSAKCLLKVKKSFSFLDIIVRQSQSLPAPVPVIFMNSYSTRNDTLDALKAYPHLFGRNMPVDFLQHKVPKVRVGDLSPVESHENPKLEWCPPGHDDIYPALVSSGMLDRLLESGYEYAFVSNSDNLGAVLEPSILGYFIQNGLSFMMEAAYNPYTKESFSGVYQRNGIPVAAAVQKINQILRDIHTDEVKQMDPALLGLMAAIVIELNTDEPIHVSSGYRSSF